jgi:serine/threonine protein phosphatase PrpC
MSFVRRLFGRKTVNKETAHASQEEMLQQRLDQAQILEKNDQDADAQAFQTLSPVKKTLEGLVLWQDAMPTSAGEAALPGDGPPTTPRHRGLRVGYASDVGQLRGHNEDTLVAFQGIHLGDEVADPFGFFVVADGMGGHRAGEVASLMAARLVTREVLNSVYLPFLFNEPPDAKRGPLTEILRDAVYKANNQVHDQVPGAGTTLTGALILGRRAYITHVGDSRAYLLVNQDILQVTQDHSFVNRLVELGELEPEEAAFHPQRHVLYRAVGQGDNLDVDTYQQLLPPHSRLLLCSDGLSGQVSEAQIGEIILLAATPQEACERLIDAANAAGGPDNITAILIEMPSD